MLHKKGARRAGLLVAALSCSALVAGGCSSGRSHVSPVSISSGSEICIIDNPRVRADFLQAYQQALVSRGYAAKVIQSTSSLGACPVTSKYVAYWQWDVVMYMSSAEISVYRDGRPAGRALFDARGSHFTSVEDKVREMVAQLYK